MPAVHCSHTLNLQAEGQGTAEFRVKSCIKIIWILNYCMYVYYHEEKTYIYTYVKYIMHTVFDYINEDIS